MRNRSVVLLFVAILGAGFARGASVQQNSALEAAQRAYEKGDYSTVLEVLQPAAKQEPRNGEIHLLLAKAYYQMQEHDRAVASAEKAVASDPKNSEYHEWLGRAYGNKADHAIWWSALSLAKKSRREFETAVQLDERNFSAMQALIEFDCSAPGIAGGGLDKAGPEIKRIATLDAAEGHYALGNCRRHKKDYATAEAEFAKALQSNPRSTDLIYDIGDHAMKRSLPDMLSNVADAGEMVAPSDPRGKFYRALAFILQKEKFEEAEALLREYLKTAPLRDNYPTPSLTHFWLGRTLEAQKRVAAAREEYQTAVRLDSKNKAAAEALKHLPKH